MPDVLPSLASALAWSQGNLQALFDGIPFAIIATGVLAAASAALVGTFLVVKGQAMLTDAISHGIVLGIAVTYLVAHVTSGPWQLLGAGVIGLITVLATEALAASRRVKRDAATGLVFPALFAAGVLLLSLYARDVHVDPHTVLLGEIGFVWLDRVAVAGIEVPRALLTLAIVLVIDTLYVLAFAKELVASAFDPVLARNLGLRPRLVHAGLLALTSMTAVAAFDAVGVVLFVAFAIVPAVTGQIVANRFGGVLAVALVCAAGAAVAGYPTAVAADVSIGGTMAALTGVPMLIALAFTRRARRGRGAKESRPARVQHGEGPLGIGKMS